MKKIIYIAHPISGDVEGNLNKIGNIFRALSLTKEIIPFAPYVAAVACLHDHVPEERQIGICQNEALFHRHAFDEVWLYGDRISAGMRAEIDLAIKLGIRVVAKTAATMAELERIYKV